MNIKKQKTASRKGKKSDENKKRMKKDVMTQAVIDLFRSDSKSVYNYKQVGKLLDIEAQVQKLQVLEILCSLSEDDMLVEVDTGRFRYNSLGTIATGTFQRRSNGHNTFVPDDGSATLRVAERNSLHAMNGDRVRVQVFAHRRGAEPEAEVLEVVETKDRNYIGTLQIRRDYAFLVTEDKTLANDIFLPTDSLRGGKNGDKAVVKIIEWPENAKNPIGEVIDILGVAGENNAEMHAILAEFGLPYIYPESVERAADGIAEEINAAEIARREDFRDVTTFTIDPKDAKDFDDALSFRATANGLWEIGVHIADVTHYVKPDDIIDREGYERATSVYLVDRTIPMLPERLSNKLCSLRQDEEKLCFSVVFELDDAAEIHASRIVRTAIRSNRRFTYEEAQEIIETGKGDYSAELLKSNDLAKKLRDKRFADGAIDFDRYEVKFDIDDKGKPLRVYFKEAQDSNHLVEEFMLLANRAVAEAIGKTPKGRSKKTFVYRVHEQPDQEKMQNFVEFVSRLGYKLNAKANKSEVTKNINSLLDKAKGKPEQNLIETLAIRSMQKAKYSTHNLGHFGLAFPFYTHFTSPIRRYPDMMVHRLLERYLDGGRSVKADDYEEYCDHCSSMEQIAANAERASIKYKQVEFMKDKIGQVYDGVISGVTEWGLYVELNENKCEGLVPVRDLTDDYYDFDEKNYCLRGKRHKHIYRLGDPLTVKIAQANLQRKQLDFAPV
ncbi:MAG: ribonuclease R [Tannerella sp.]|jgi:ribonuclease R|nr:ribonuclease R [Tannerella sp.]